MFIKKWVYNCATFYFDIDNESDYFCIFYISIFSFILISRPFFLGLSKFSTSYFSFVSDWIYSHVFYFSTVTCVFRFIIKVFSSLLFLVFWINWCLLASFWNGQPNDIRFCRLSKRTYLMICERYFSSRCASLDLPIPADTNKFGTYSHYNDNFLSSYWPWWYITLLVVPCPKDDF